MNTFPSMEKDTEELKRIMFIRGVKAGMWLFAVWRNGKQYVGNLELIDAIEALDKGVYNEMIEEFYRGNDEIHNRPKQ